MEEDDTNDASVLRPAIQIGVRGIGQILKVYHAGTEEIKKLLTHECDIIFECKVCRSLFRGLPNLIAHKRAYCMKEYVEERRDFPNFYSSDVVTVLPEATHKPEDGSELSRLLKEPAVSPNGRGCGVIKKTNLMTQLSPKPAPSRKTKPPFVVQTEVPDSQPQAEEAPDPREETTEVEEVTPTSSQEEVQCTVCLARFGKPRNLLMHVKNMHGSQKTLYKCPCCPVLYGYIKSVRRHLQKNHGKAPNAITRLIQISLRNAIKVPNKTPVSSPEQNAPQGPLSVKPVPSASAVSVVSEPGSFSTETNQNLVSATKSVSPKSVALAARLEVGKAMSESGDEWGDVEDRLKCPDCGKTFEKQKILDRHMKVCADYAKIAVTFDMSRNRGLQHLTTHGPQVEYKTKGTQDDNAKHGRKRKGFPSRFTAREIESDMESDSMSVASESSSKISIDMPKLVPVLPDRPPVLASSRPDKGKKTSNDEDDAKQTKIKNIETVLQFLKNPTKKSIKSFASGAECKQESCEYQSDTECAREPPKLEKEVDVKPSHYKTYPPTIIVTRHKASLSESEESGKKDSSMCEDNSKSPKAKHERSVSLSPARPRAGEKPETVVSSPKAAILSALKAEPVSPSPKQVVALSRSHLTRRASRDSHPSDIDSDTDQGKIVVNTNGDKMVTRKRERSPERRENPAKRRDTSGKKSPPLFDQSKPSVRQPRNTSSLTTHRRQSCLDDDPVSKGTEVGKTQASESRGSSLSESGVQTNLVAASSGPTAPVAVRKSGRVIKKPPSRDLVSPERKKPATDSNGNDTADDCDEAGMLKRMLEDATSNRDNKQPSPIPNHISKHLNYAEKMCNICNKKFTSIPGLITHVSKIHMKMKRYQCGLCNLEGLYFSEITRHIARTHRKEFRANRKSEWLSMCVKPITTPEEAVADSAK